MKKKKKNGAVKAKILLDPIFYEKNVTQEISGVLGLRRMSLPSITVCLLLDPDWKHVVARGISIRSLEDQFRRKKGRDKSYGRAIQAYVNGKDSLPIMPSRFEDRIIYFGGIGFDGKMPLVEAAEIGAYKSMYYPTGLTKEEIEMMKIYREKKELKKEDKESHVDQGPDHPET